MGRVVDAPSASPDFLEICEAIRRCRVRILEMTARAGAGHPGGSLSAIDSMVALYLTQLRVRVDEPKWADRDRFILSKGHASPAMYATLAEIGMISEEDLLSYREFGGTCQGHVDSKWTPGVDFSGGSLGMGLSFGIGEALAAHLDGSKRVIWVMLGDGECQEGQIWEAAMSAVHHDIRNIRVLIDKNRIQNDDHVHLQMDLGDLESKWKAFGWAAETVDGHSIEEILDGFEWMNQVTGPSVLILDTVKGKGVSFMENNPKFHGMAPSEKELDQALEELSQ